jgi:type VI protein secretion system component VasK
MKVRSPLFLRKFCLGLRGARVRHWLRMQMFSSTDQATAIGSANSMRAALQFGFCDTKRIAEFTHRVEALCARSDE